MSTTTTYGPKLGSATDAVAGAAGGITSVILGHPFDLIKVQLQIQNSSNVVRVVKDIFKNEGPLAFYKGALLPFLGVSAATSAPNGNAPWSPRLNYYLAGTSAGVANSLISGPVEHIRIRLQTQPNGTSRLYSGPWDCIRQIVSKSGYKGLFRAQSISVVREAQAYGCYFLTFETSMDEIVKRRHQKRGEVPIWMVGIAGGLSGIAFWLCSYPLDVVKSKLQSDGFGKDRKYRNTWDAFRMTWREGKLLGFWRGLSPTLVRTMLSSAGCYVLVEQVRKRLE